MYRCETQPKQISECHNVSNNSAWVKFTLSTDSNGNRKLTVTGHSPCDSPGMCGEVSANR